MEIRLLSDLHFEFRHDLEAFSDSLDFQPGQVCVLAGDIVVADDISRISYLFDKWPGTQFLWVPGNGEFFGGSFETVRWNLRALESVTPNLQVLMRDRAEIDGVQFLGCTLWYPPPRSFREFEACPDYEMIYDGFRIPYEAGMDAEFLRQADNYTVVITHMLPHYCAIKPPYVGLPRNQFFVHDMTDVINSRQPRLWLFGHTHACVDERVGTTRLVCNPRGQAWKADSVFDPHFVIHV